MMVLKIVEKERKKTLKGREKERCQQSRKSVKKREKMREKIRVKLRLVPSFGRSKAPLFGVRILLS